MKPEEYGQAISSNTKQTVSTNNMHIHWDVVYNSRS